jgi:hypothetical protein
MPSSNPAAMARNGSQPAAGSFLIMGVRSGAAAHPRLCLQTCPARRRPLLRSTGPPVAAGKPVLNRMRNHLSIAHPQSQTYRNCSRLS